MTLHIWAGAERILEGMRKAGVPNNDRRTPPRREPRRRRRRPPRLMGEDETGTFSRVRPYRSAFR